MVIYIDTDSVIWKSQSKFLRFLNYLDAQEISQISLVAPVIPEFGKRVGISLQNLSAVKVVCSQLLEMQPVTQRALCKERSWRGKIAFR